eukprot:1792530-Rhodomonas_salina.1
MSDDHTGERVTTTEIRVPDESSLRRGRESTQRQASAQTNMTGCNVRALEHVPVARKLSGDRANMFEDKCDRFARKTTE